MKSNHIKIAEEELRNHFETTISEKFRKRDKYNSYYSPTIQVQWNSYRDCAKFYTEKVDVLQNKIEELTTELNKFYDNKYESDKLYILAGRLKKR